jgi:hypothetical protein
MSRQQNTAQCLTEFLCMLIFALSLIGAPIFIPLGAVFLWQDCNHAVSAQVLSIRALPEYGRCQVKVTYDSYDGAEQFALVETACPGLTSGTKVLTGCYNHYHPDQYKAQSDTTRTNNISHIAAIAIFTIGLVMLTFLILTCVCTCWLGISWTRTPPRTQHQTPPDDQENIAIGLPVLEQSLTPTNNPATNATLKRANSV